jgi:predicted RNA binding protein YcfA (HicA-like mRNA interferase family)
VPKLYSVRLILAGLKRAGFVIASQKGSHIKLSRRASGKALTVIVPNHKEVSGGTFSSILNQANLTHKEFEKFVK